MYDGQWEADKKTGEGTLTWPEKGAGKNLVLGGTYVGTWKQGVRNGHGETTLSDGQHYVGQASLLTYRIRSAFYSASHPFVHSG